ncbi:MAG TPA: MBL fold metallo-hydrolase [Gemmatimonadales bacterium]
MAAHHRPGGGFQNPWTNGREPGFRDFLKWVLIERPRHGRPPDPPRAVFVRATPSFPTPRAPAERTVLTWVGHSTFLLQIGGLNVLTDPMWSARASPVSFAGPRRWVAPGIAFDALPPIDVVLQSHNHYDHLDTTTVRRLAAAHPTARWLAPLGVAALLRGAAAVQVLERDWWEEYAVGGVRFVCTPARHFSSRHLFDRNATLWCGWAAIAAGRRVLFGGDSAYHPAFAEIGSRCGPFDVALLPIGAYEPRWFMRFVHMSPEETVQALVDLDPAGRTALVPMHWGTFKLTDEPMDEPPARVARAWEAAGRPADRLWRLAHGETRAL